MCGSGQPVFVNCLFSANAARNGAAVFVESPRRRHLHQLHDDRQPGQPERRRDLRPAEHDQSDQLHPVVERAPGSLPRERHGRDHLQQHPGRLGRRGKYSQRPAIPRSGRGRRHRGHDGRRPEALHGLALPRSWATTARFRVPMAADLDGNSRIANGRVDIGAYEFNGPFCYYVDAATGNDLNGGWSPREAFATIQKGINVAREGYTVVVAPGVYQEDIDFRGKAVTVAGLNGAPTLESPDEIRRVVLLGRGAGQRSEELRDRQQRRRNLHRRQFSDHPERDDCRQRLRDRRVRRGQTRHRQLHSLGQSRRRSLRMHSAVQLHPTGA